MQDKQNLLVDLRLLGQAYKNLSGKNPHDLAMEIMEDKQIKDFKSLTKDELLDFNAEFRKRMKAETILQRRKMTIEGWKLI